MSKKSNKKNQDKKYQPYFVDKFASIPAHVKIYVMKFWVFGASFYITVNGLPQRFDYLDRLVIFTLVLILVTEYISHTVIYWMHTDQIDTKRYLPHVVKKSSVFSLLATALYIIILVFLTSTFIDRWVLMGLPTIGDILSESTADPFTFGLVMLLFDYLWIKIRTLIESGRKKEI